MKNLVKSFGLSVQGIFHPWVLWLSLRPFLMSALVWFGILWFFWTPLLDQTKNFITNSALTSWIFVTMNQVGWGDLRSIISPYLSVVIIMPLIILTLLLIVSFTSISGVVGHVGRAKNYQDLNCAHGGSFWGSIANTSWSTFICLLLIIVTLPVWWIPPIFAIIPPLLWGWLTTRLMSYDVLAKHASEIERKEILREHKWPLLTMGIITGLMGAIPSFFWLSSVFVLILFPLVSIFMMWVYSLVFIFASLLFSHYLLLALKNRRLLKGDLM